MFPNLLSFVRILIGFAIPVLVLCPASDLTLQGNGRLISALVLFIFGVLTDYWDGWVARRHRLETSLGKILDPTADKIFILSTMASFAARGLYSYWYLVPIFFRELAVTFCRLACYGQGRAIGAERAGKIKLGFQSTSVLCSFIYLAYPSRFIFLLNHAVLICALTLTLYSGYFFFLHNLSVLREKSFLRTVAALGVGYLRPFPGTYGSLLGLLFLPLIHYDPLLHVLVLLAFILLAYGVLFQMGLGPTEDPSEVVIDEFCGVLLTFLAVPLNPLSLGIGFFLFRFFDISKFFPIHWLERRKGAHGIIWDDLGAGGYAWLVLKILFH